MQQHTCHRHDPARRESRRQSLCLRHSRGRQIHPGRHSRGQAGHSQAALGHSPHWTRHNAAARWAAAGPAWIVLCHVAANRAAVQQLHNRKRRGSQTRRRSLCHSTWNLQLGDGSEARNITRQEAHGSALQPRRVLVRVRTLPLQPEMASWASRGSSNLTNP